jgi:tripartite-type tricarboxylate transporter receptor subunit TctC
MGTKISRLTVAFAVGLLLSRWLGLAGAQEPFYKGKNIRIIVGGSAGGGYDTYSRAIARHWSKHIPGSPTIVVENMTGAASLIAANYVYKVAKPDGLSIGHFIGGLILQQVLGKVGIEFDARKFEYLGVPAQDNTVIGISKASGIAGVEPWLASKTTLKFGAVGPGTATYDITKIVVATVGLPIQLVSGYKGTAEIRLAFNSGEVHGITNAWESFKSSWPKELASGSVVIVLQAIPRRHPELPKVPLLIDFAKTDEARQLIQTGVHDYAAVARPYVLPPGTPKERVQLLRKALADTMKDPDFLGEAKKARLDIDPLSGEELERIVAGTFKLAPELVEKLKEILK